MSRVLDPSQNKKEYQDDEKEKLEKYSQAKVENQENPKTNIDLNSLEQLAAFY
jgi:hypothetical protein